MLRVKKPTFFEIKTIFCALFLTSFFVQEVRAQFDIGNSDLTREIEKNLLFDKSAQEKFDVYNNEYGTNLVNEPTIGSLPPKDEDEKKYTPEEMNIVLVDKVKIDKDVREKEKLAYNSVLVGQYEIAIQMYKEILQKEPQNLYAKYSLGVVYQRLAQNKQAKNIYYDLLKGDAENKDEIINNIIAILIEETPREAIYMLNRLTIQNPQKHYLFASMALAYEKISDYNSAIKNYTKALELDYNNMDYCYNLGVLYDENKEYEKALEMYSVVVKNNDSSNREIALDSVKRRIEKIKQMI
jgi:tetratricopeptide (TPR) repeat protein